MVANMLIVTVTPLNKVKEAKRLVNGDMIVVNGGVIGTVTGAKFVDVDPEVGRYVRVEFDVLTEAGKAEQSTKVPEGHPFNVVELVTK